MENKRKVYVENMRNMGKVQLNNVERNPELRTNSLAKAGELNCDLGQIAQWVRDIAQRATRLEQASAYSRSGNVKVPVYETYSAEEISSFLRQPDEELGERPCVFMKICQSYKKAGYVCREFLTKQQEAQRRLAVSESRDTHEHLPEKQQMCVICHRAITTFLHDFYENGIEARPDYVIQLYEVQVDSPGQYSSKYCLLGDEGFTGITAPFPRFGWQFYRKSRIVDNSGRTYDGWIELPPLLFH